MIKKSVLAVVVLMVLINCGMEKIVSEDDKNKESLVLIDTTVSVSAQNAVITVNDGFSLVIPQGINASPFPVNIKKPQKPIGCDEIKILNCYDITLGIGNSFTSPLTITIPYDISLVVNPDSLKAVYFDEVRNAWIPFESGVAENGNFTFTTNHLTVVGVVEFLTNGGYAHKFTGVNGVIVYYNLTGSHVVMNSSDYGEFADQPYHIPTSDPLFSTVYIQDIAFALKDAREKFAAVPYSLQGPANDETINIYVKDLDGSDGSFGTVSGAIYINNTVTAPSQPSGISNRQILQATVAHEYLHFIQDYYYVVNNASIGLWWLEAIATQADWMVWGSKYSFSESEIYSIESNAALVENLSKSWDNCSSDPNWYLAGCFLNYLGRHRDGTKLNIASILKAGGSSASIYRIVLNTEISNQLSSDISKEFTNYVRYLFEEGNENLTVFTDGMAYVESNPAFNKTVQREKNSTREVCAVGVPYLGAKMVTLVNSGTDTLKTKIGKSSASLNADIYLCKYDQANDKFIGFTQISNDEVISILPGKNDKDYILIINHSFTTSDTVKLTMAKAQDAKIDIFQFMKVTLEASNEAIGYSDGKAESNFEIGFLSNKTDEYRSIESVFKSDGTFSIIADKVSGVASSGGLDQEATTYDSCRVKIWGKYEESTLYDVEFSQFRQVITPDDAWITAKNGRDTVVTSYFDENRSLKIDTIQLDQSSEYYTYYKMWNGSGIQPHVSKVERDFVRYAHLDGDIDTLMPYTKITSIDWDIMVIMSMLCGKK